ncbi:MAG: GH36-type glycosyl hydrolase domain-containing protein, partial [Acutalibacteraceae bacterium]
CLHALYGDWNDALDGLGKTSDQTREFGTGVSVMTSLQLYQNCGELCEILEHTGNHREKCAEYKQYAEILKNGLTKYAIDTNNDGERRVIHGWGDKMSYKIGSWHDPDGVSRASNAATSFWAISGMIKNDPSMKESIMSTFKTLDSKYGIMTFDKAFPLDMHKYVGRIANITAGTYENAGTYVHATMFAVSALFLMGESEEAWRQFSLATVLSHKDCSKSPFAMPNSYFRNEDWCIDGQSFADWYTGSGTVFIKNLIKYGFGVCPTLDGLVIQTAATMPTADASLDIVVKGHPITVKYQNKGVGRRAFTVNGKEIAGAYDEMMKINKLFIPTADITDGTVIEVID